jgi:hypothetical protein
MRMLDNFDVIKQVDVFRVARADIGCIREWHPAFFYDQVDNLVVDRFY